MTGFEFGKLPRHYSPPSLLFFSKIIIQFVIVAWGVYVYPLGSDRQMKRHLALKIYSDFHLKTRLVLHI